MNIKKHIQQLSMVICPHCKSDNTYLVIGREVIIKNIEI